MRNRTLKSNLELFAAANNQRNVKVIQRDEDTGEEFVHEKGAVIEKFVPDCVKIGGAYYFRQVVEIFVT